MPPCTSTSGRPEPARRNPILAPSADSTEPVVKAVMEPMCIGLRATEARRHARRNTHPGLDSLSRRQTYLSPKACTSSARDETHAWDGESRWWPLTGSGPGSTLPGLVGAPSRTDATIRAAADGSSDRHREVADGSGSLPRYVKKPRASAGGVFQMLITGELYDDLGGDHYRKRDPQRTTKRLITQFGELGHTVTLHDAAAA
jgi:hypothetical protein